MLKYSDIISAINKKISDKFPTIQIQASIAGDGVAKPYFFTSLDNINIRNCMEVFAEKKMTAYIYYVPSEYDQAKIMEMQSDLESLFFNQNMEAGGISSYIDEMKLNIDESSTGEKSLLCSFELIFNEMQQEETHENMEELKMKK